MSAAPNYTPETSFADDETNNVAGRSLVKTDSLDSELANISSSINGINTNLQAIQRDDNKLLDSIVEPYALAEQTRALIAVAGCTPRGTWQPNTDYAFKDVIQRSNVAQICLQSHNSGTSFTQSFWLPISGDGTSAANAAAAAASALAASTSETNSNTSAIAAASSASSASTSATNAATAATNASNSASSASTSAASATNSATAAATSATNAQNAANSIAAITTATNDPTFSDNDSSPVSSDWVKGLALIKQGLGVTTNGAAAYDFTGIPAGAKRITINFNGVSTNGNSVIQIQVGNGSFVSSGYSSSAVGFNGTTLLATSIGSGFGISESNTASYTFFGSITLENESANRWMSKGNFYRTSGQASIQGGGVSLGSALDRVRITTVNGTDLFDGGTVNISWEF